MKNVCAIVLFALLAVAASAKGAGGIYYITGTAYDANKTVLKNADLTVLVENVKQVIRTDNNGHFEIQVSWRSACRSHRSKAQHAADNKGSNAEFILVSYNGKQIQLENKWKRYGRAFPDSKKQVTWKKDLYFK